MADRGKFKLEIRIRNKKGKYAFHTPVYAANGKLKPSVALVSGKQEFHQEGIYDLRCTSNAPEPGE